MQAYTHDVYRRMHAASHASARRIAPRLVQRVRPASVVDFGCGTGDWLAAFGALGSVELLGLDGPWVDRDLLAVPDSSFRPTDLREPVVLPHEYDLALCLEVIGHVPPTREAALLDSLTRAAPVVVFSGPIPPQGGIGEDATNRRWPAYWAERFVERGFAPVDCLRLAMWDDPDIAWWFRQNLFVAVRRDVLARYPLLREEHARHGERVLPLVHPECCDAAVAEAARLRNASLPGLARGTVAGLAGGVRARVRARRGAGDAPAADARRDAGSLPDGLVTY